MSVGIKIPDIRIKGFNEEWVERELGAVAEIKTGPFGSSLHAEAYIEYGHAIITTEHFKSGELPVDKKGIPQVCDEDYLRLKAYLLKTGDIVFSRVGSVDINAHVTDQQDGWLFSGRVLRVRSNDSIDSEYLHHELSTSRVRKSVVSKAVGQTMPSINTEILKITPIHYPVDKTEQTAIGTYFQKLDNLIKHHQQKHDKLCNIKKAMLGKMFPKQGETIPEIRFKEFSGEWEEKELGELAEIVRGASPRPIEDPKWFDKSSNVGWLRIRDVTEQDGRIHFLEQRISKLGQEKTRVLFEPHLLLSIAASVGKPVINYIETGVHDGFLIFKKPRFELEFMYQWLKSFELEWQQYGQPGSQVNLNSDIVKGQLVSIPSNEEQIAIGNYFQKLDALINQHQQQITKLNNIKQACLSKMFV
ncbi:TPA: restriction endonuclease subunit S [Vibrio vulnificus]|nr:restriction endonuclease subunit S [Vibrio vulnificus]